MRCAFSALTLLVGWQACKKLSGGMLVWLPVLARCRFAYGPADATATLSLAPVSPDWFYCPSFTFLVPAHPDSPGQSPGGHKMVVVVVVDIDVIYRW